MNYIYATGNFFGWLTVVFFGAAILNYCIKFLNKHWGKKLKTSPIANRGLSLGMKFFVKYHRMWGFLAFISLLLHFLIQFLRFGLSITGLIVAILLLFEIFLGFYAYQKKLPRKGIWFVIHRSIALLLIIGVITHIQLPFGLPQTASTKTQPSSAQISSTQAASTQTVAAKTTFTLSELKTYNGQNGQPAYVAYKGTVYDVSNVPEWKNGTHHGIVAGTDVTNEISKSPHGVSVLSNIPVVGTLKD